MNIRSLILPINRCNLPGYVLASLAYQRSPVELELDGILPHFADLFTRLRHYHTPKERAECFVAIENGRRRIRDRNPYG